MHKTDFPKTSTVTFHHERNYGAFLQSWALQQFLGDSNTILNFIPSYYYQVGEKGRKILPFFWRIVALWRYLKCGRGRKFLDEMKILRLSRKYSRTEEIINKPPTAEIYITGSDQVWNTNFVEFFHEVYFLKFGYPDVKKVAYAASMGAKSWTSDFTREILPQLKTFHAISVREESAASFLKTAGLSNVETTCDPTILFNAEYYRSHFIQSKTKLSNHIFLYRLREKLSPSIHNLLNGKNVVTVDLEKYKNIIPVSQWLYNIDTANFVLTDSFHCVVFSIIFHKPFIILPATQKQDTGMNERFVTLLGKTNLAYRLLNGNETQQEIENIIYHSIDWEQVDVLLEEWRNKSANWLINALNE